MEQRDTDVAEDCDLVQRAQAGDTTAFAALYREHVGRVYAICLRMVANKVRAEQLTQDTFVRAWHRLESFRGESAFSSWLYRVAVNIVLTDVRTVKRRSARFLVTDDLSPFGTTDTATDSDDGFDAALDLEKALAALPPQARRVLVLHELEGYRHKDIAALLGIAPGTSKAHLHRARKLLKKILNQ